MWQCSWQGRASDLDPYNLPFEGKTKLMGAAAREAMFDAVQTIASEQPLADIKIDIAGQERNPMANPPILGSFRMQVVLLEEQAPSPGEVLPLSPPSETPAPGLSDDREHV